MWLFTKHGFFSVVVDKRNDERMVIRTRDVRHLNLLKKHIRSLQSIAIETNVGTDYPYRISVDRLTWEVVCAILAHEIDYTNFKSATEEVAGKVGLPYVDALHDIWTVMFKAFRKEFRWKGSPTINKEY